MCFCHIHRRPLTPLRHTLLLLIPLTSCSCFYKITQQPQFALPMYSQVCGPSRGVWSTYPGPQPLGKTTFPSPREPLVHSCSIKCEGSRSFPYIWWNNVDWLDLVWVLCRQDHSCWVHEYSILLYPEDTASFQSSPHTHLWLLQSFYTSSNSQVPEFGEIYIFIYD